MSTLAERLATRVPLPLAEILQVGSEIARCLAHLHAAGRSHLDLCPAKVCWSETGDQIDLQLGPPQERGADHQPLGSIDPGYASPELLQNAAVDARSDLFSLGCILYAMSTGHGPFWGATPADLARSVCEAQPRPPCQLNPRLTAWLSAVIMKLLEKDPARRFSDAGQLSDMLSLQSSMAHTVRRPLPRMVPERSEAIRVPMSELVASPATPPAANVPEAGGNGHHEAQRAVDPAALAKEMATLAEAMTAVPAAGSFRHWTELAGKLLAIPVLVGAGLLAYWWLQPLATRHAAAVGSAQAPAPSVDDEPPGADDEPPVTGPKVGPIAFTETAALGGRKGEMFEELSESLDPVIGFEITTSGSDAHRAIQSIRAIYREGKSKRLGQVFGAPLGKVKRIEARSGYAVAGIFVRANSRVDGMKVRFMRWEGKALNTKRLYDSDWIGGTSGRSEKLLGGNGRLVIGIHGRSSQALHAIGLMQTLEQASGDSP